MSLKQNESCRLTTDCLKDISKGDKNYNSVSPQPITDPLRAV